MDAIAAVTRSRDREMKIPHNIEMLETLTKYVLALKKISDIPLGPDKGSAQSQIDCAVEIAKKALS